MPKTKKAKRSKVTPKDVKVAVDPSLKKAWDAIAKRIDAAEHEGASSFDELWEAAAEAVDHDPPLYVFGGYKTAAEFFKERLHTDVRTAQRNMRVARYASPAEEERYGTTNLDAALGWLEAKHGPLNGRLPVAFDKLKISIEDKPTPFAELTAAQINAGGGADRVRRALREGDRRGEGAGAEGVSDQSAPASLGVPQQTPASVDTRVPLGH